MWPLFGVAQLLNVISSYWNAKMLCRLAEHRLYIAMLPRHITTRTALLKMIAYLRKESKKMLELNSFLTFVLDDFDNLRKEYPSSLFIAMYFWNCYLAIKQLHNIPLRVTMQPT